MSVFGASAQTPLPPTNAIPTSQKILRALPTPILKAANSSFMAATSSSLTSSLPKQKRVKREKKAAANGTAPTNKSTTHPDMPDQIPHGLNDIGVTELTLQATENMDQILPTVTNGHHTRQMSQSSAAQSNPASRRPSRMEENAEAERERQQTYDSRLTHAIWQLATTGANPAVDLLVCLERRHTIGFRYVDITRPVVIHHGSRDTRVPVENVKWLGKTMRRCEVRVLEGEGHGLMASAKVMGGILMEVSREWEEWGRVTGATKREGERARRGTVGPVR
jgi:hypothetical protein